MASEAVNAFALRADRPNHLPTPTYRLPGGGGAAAARNQLTCPAQLHIHR